MMNKTIHLISRNFHEDAIMESVDDRCLVDCVQVWKLDICSNEVVKQADMEFESTEDYTTRGPFGPRQLIIPTKLHRLVAAMV